MDEQTVPSNNPERPTKAEQSNTTDTPVAEQGVKPTASQQARPNAQERATESKRGIPPQSALAHHADYQGNDNIETPEKNAVTPGEQENIPTPSKNTKVRQCRSLSNRLMIIFTAVIAASTFGYAIVAGWQLWVMSGQLDQMELSSRAWVGFQNGTCSKIAPEKNIEITLVFKNTGATPANKMKIGFVDSL
jgi:hypothetical protein